MPSPLVAVRAAQLRVRARRGAILRVLGGSIFLAGALSYPLGPTPDDESSLTWTAILLVMSAGYVGWGLRGLSRLSRTPPWIWMAGTGAWAILSVALAALLMRR